MVTPPKPSIDGMKTSTESPPDFQRGVEVAEKLWEKAVGQLMAEASLEVSYLHCGKCGQRYALPKDRSGALPLILCPHCRRYDDGISIGVCRPINRTIQVTRGEWLRESLAARNVVQAARDVIEALRANHGVRDAVETLTDKCNYYDTANRKGWSLQEMSLLTEVDLAPVDTAGKLQPFTETVEISN